MPKVTFVKGKKKTTLDVPEGTNLRRAALQNGVQLYWGPHKIANCLGNGSCGSCMVAVLKGKENLNSKTTWEKARLAAGPITSMTALSYEGDQEVRLACKTLVQGDCEVETTPAVNWHGDKFWS